MKRIALIVFIVSLAYLCNAQTTEGGSPATPREVLASSIQTSNGVLKVDKVDRPALIAEYNIDPSTMEDALKESFKSKGIKMEKSKGLLVAKGVTIAEMDNNKFDLYFDIDKKSKSEKDKSVVKMAIASGYDNFIDASAPAKYEGAAKFTALSLSPSLHNYKLQNDVSNQAEICRKADKKYTDLVKESEKLEKQRKEIENDIAVNKKDQEDQLKEIEKQKAEMAALKATVVK